MAGRHRARYRNARRVRRAARAADASADDPGRGGRLHSLPRPARFPGRDGRGGRAGGAGDVGPVRAATRPGMIALDTNAVLRLLIRDDPEQTKRAADIVRDHRVLLTTTVLLETEWVLRSHYRVPRTAIAEGMRRLIDLDRLTLDHPTVAARGARRLRGVPRLRRRPASGFEQCRERVRNLRPRVRLPGRCPRLGAASPFVRLRQGQSTCKAGAAPHPPRQPRLLHHRLADVHPRSARPGGRRRGQRTASSQLGRRWTMSLPPARPRRRCGAGIRAATP